MAAIFPAAVYLLCFLTALACAALLAKSYRRTRARLLLWSAICFAGLAVNNLIVVVDLLVMPERDLRLARHIVSLAAISVLLIGFVWGEEE